MKYTPMKLARLRLTEEEFVEACSYSPVMSPILKTRAYRLLVRGESASAIARDSQCSVTAIALGAKKLLSRWYKKRYAYFGLTTSDGSIVPHTHHIPDWIKRKIEANQYKR